MVQFRVGVSDRTEGGIIVEPRRHDDRVRGLQSRRVLGGQTRTPRAPDGLHVFLGLHQSRQVHRRKQIDDHHILERRTGKNVTRHVEILLVISRLKKYQATWVLWALSCE